MLACKGSCRLQHATGLRLRVLTVTWSALILWASCGDSWGVEGMGVHMRTAADEETRSDESVVDMESLKDDGAVISAGEKQKAMSYAGLLNMRKNLFRNNLLGAVFGVSIAQWVAYFIQDIEHYQKKGLLDTERQRMIFAGRLRCEHALLYTIMVGVVTTFIEVVMTLRNRENFNCLDADVGVCVREELPNNYIVSYLTDVRGAIQTVMAWAEVDNNIKIETYVGKHSCIADFKFTFQNNRAIFVYGGNAIGQGTQFRHAIVNGGGECALPGLKPTSIIGSDIRLRKALIDFKNRHPTRVFLLAGQHDIFAELKTTVDSLVDMIHEDHLAEGTESEKFLDEEDNAAWLVYTKKNWKLCDKAWTPIQCHSVMATQFVLSNNLNVPHLFEARKNELYLLNNKYPDDLDVATSLLSEFSYSVKDAHEKLFGDSKSDSGVWGVPLATTFGRATMPGFRLGIEYLKNCLVTARIDNALYVPVSVSGRDANRPKFVTALNTEFLDVVSQVDSYHLPTREKALLRLKDYKVYDEQLGLHSPLSAPYTGAKDKFKVKSSDFPNSFLDPEVQFALFNKGIDVIFIGSRASGPFPAISKVDLPRTLIHVYGNWNSCPTDKCTLGDTGGAAFAIVKSMKKLLLDGRTAALHFGGNPSWVITEEGDKFRAVVPIDSTYLSHTIKSTTDYIGRSYTDKAGLQWRISGLLIPKSTGPRDSSSQDDLVAVHRNEDMTSIKTMGAFMISLPTQEDLKKSY